MMNHVSLMGRLVADPVLQTFERDGKEGAVARYRLAVERDYKKGGYPPGGFLLPANPLGRKRALPKNISTRGI